MQSRLKQLNLNDLAMRHISTRKYLDLDSMLEQVAVQGVVCQMQHTISLDEDSSAMPIQTQLALKNIRSSFDGFSETEVDLLLQHGYSVARCALQSQLPSQVSTHQVRTPYKSDTSNLHLVKKLNRSHSNRISLWSFSDPISWATLGLAIPYFILIWVLFNFWWPA